MHNAFMHALVQTGTLGTLAFVASLILGWALLTKAMFSLGRYSAAHKSLIVQAGGILMFLTFRGSVESSGAFFGVDLLLLAPMLLYLHVVTNFRGSDSEGSEDGFTQAKGLESNNE